MYRLIAKVVFLGFVCIFVLSCADDGSEKEEYPTNESGMLISLTGVEELPHFNTFIEKYMQIEKHDANLVRNVLGENDVDEPGPGNSEDYWDWEDLALDANNHSLADNSDLDDAFVAGGPCVGIHGSPKKGDITGIAFANNSQYVYFEGQRKDNSGDVAHYFVFTQEPQNRVPGGVDNDCDPEDKYPLWKIVAGDVLVRVVYPGNNNSPPKIGVYTAIADPEDNVVLDAEQLVDTLSPLNGSIWNTPITPNTPASDIHIGTNITPTLATTYIPDAKESYVSGTNSLQPRIAIEFAIPLTYFVPGGGPACDVAFYGSGFTQSSHSFTSRLKDFIPEGFFVFVGLDAVAEEQSTCPPGEGINSKVYNVTEINGKPLENPPADWQLMYTCEWSFTTLSDPSFEAIAVGCMDIEPPESLLRDGTTVYDVELTIQDPNGCTFVKDDLSSLILYPALNVQGTLSSDKCEESFDYNASVEGGTKSYSYEWTFSNGATSLTQFGTEYPAPGDVLPKEYDGELTVTDNGTNCTQRILVDPVTVYPDLLVTKAQLRETCFQQFGYSALASGGSDSYTFAWTFSNGATSSAPEGIVVLAPGELLPNQYSGEVTVTDTITKCEQQLTADDVWVYAPLLVELAEMTGNCNDAFHFNAQASGGTEDYGYKWIFAGDNLPATVYLINEGDVSVATSPYSHLPPRPYSGTVVVMDMGRDPDLKCENATDDADTIVYSPLVVTLSQKTLPQACPSMISDAVKFQAHPSGGSIPLLTWTYQPECNVNLDKTCWVDPAPTPDDFCDSAIVEAAVQESDPIAIIAGCTNDVSNQFIVTKTTSVTVAP